MDTSRKTLKVGLLWHSMTSDNLGVGALTLGQMALITAAARQSGFECQFLVIGTKGGTPYPVDDFQIGDTAEFALRAFKTGDFRGISLLRHCDIVFDIGEGDSFADIYGNKRLAIQVFAKLLVAVFGKTLILAPQTIGPFKTSTGRFLGQLGMKCAKRLFARDNLSMQYLADLGNAKKSIEVIDVAFALPFNKSLFFGGPAITRIGINVSGLLYNGGYNGRNEFNLSLDYRKLIEDACSYFTKLPNTEVYLVSHVISAHSETEDDYRASEKLVEKYPTLKMAPRFRSPSEAKSFISNMDFFTGARMHACIAAFSSGVPVLPMAYSRKFNGLFNSLGYRHIIDCLVVTTDNALQMLKGGFEERTSLAGEVERGNQIAQGKLKTYVEEIGALLPKT